MIGRLWYFFRRALANMKGEGTAAFLTFMVVTISFIIFGAYVALGANVAGFMEGFSGNVQIVFYLNDDAEPAAIKSLVKSLGAEREVKKARFIGSREALQRLKRDLVGAPEFLAGLEESPLPASVEVELRAPFRGNPDLGRILSRYRDVSIIESIDAGDDFTDAFARVLAGIWLAGVVIAVFLMASAVFIVANTIRLTIIRRRDEIDNMRLVGATNRFVKAPFLIEGVLVGAAGAAFAALGLYLIYLFVLIPATVTAPVISVLTGFEPRFLSLRMVLGGIGLGAIVGYVGAQLSIGRYLDL